MKKFVTFSLMVLLHWIITGQDYIQTTTSTSGAVKDLIHVKTLSIGHTNTLNLGSKARLNLWSNWGNWISLVDGFSNDLYGFHNPNNGGRMELYIKNGETGSSQFGVFTVKKDGKIGIGTTNPLARLHVNNGDNSYGSILANANESAFSLYTKTLSTQPANIESFRLGLKYGTNENNGFISFYRGGSSSGGFLGFATNGSERFRISANGYVGIGTTNPSNKLDVNGGVQSKALVLIDPELGSNSDYTALYREDVGNDNSTVKLRIGDDVLGSFSVGYKYWKTGEWKTSFYVNNNGNVGIGTSDPKGYKLAVAGKAIAEEIKVKLQTSWPDFVFADDYQLPTLNEVEQHIQQKGHLINIPSAAEVAENGIYLGEMNAKLLEKIEELTLYTIVQEKEIKQLKEQTAKIKILEEQIQELINIKK